jgi:hypothetical protein
VILDVGMDRNARQYSGQAEENECLIAVVGESVCETWYGRQYSLATTSDLARSGSRGGGSAVAVSAQSSVVLPCQVMVIAFGVGRGAVDLRALHSSWREVWIGLCGSDNFIDAESCARSRAHRHRPLLTSQRLRLVPMWLHEPRGSVNVTRA